MRTAAERLLLRLEWRVIRRLDGQLQGGYRTSHRGSGIDFVSADQIGTAAQEAGLDEPTTQALVDDYESAQLQALKTGLLAAAFLALLSLAFTKQLPHELPRKEEQPARDTPVGSGGRAQNSAD